ncbi:MAG: condensation domain-containing protein [Pseudanabaena sp.]
MERFLGAFEHSFWLYDQVHPVHFALCAKISGTFTSDQLQRALSQVQQQHPLLRVKIQTSPSGHPQFVEQKAEIPLRIVQRTDRLQWQRELELELSLSFNWAIAPLVRVVWLHSQGNQDSELIITLHHSIADGLSGAYLIRDIVARIATPNCSATAISRELTTSAPVESIIPQSFRFPTESPHQSDHVAAQEQAAFYADKATTRVRPHVRTAILSAQLTKQLSVLCREEHTTVHGAIGAAFLLALASQGKTDLSHYKCLSPISIRSHLPATVQEDVGLYITYGLTHHQVTASSLFWEVARSLKSQLDDARQLQQLFGNFAPRQAVMTTCPDAQIVVQGMQQQYGYDLLVTNLGKLTFGQQFGGLKVKELYAPAVMAGVENERVVGVATLGDRLSLTACFDGANISAAIATDIVDQALFLLHSIYQRNFLISQNLQPALAK